MNKRDFFSPSALVSKRVGVSRLFFEVPTKNNAEEKIYQRKQLDKLKWY